MILTCSAGHITDTDKLSLSGSMHKKPGDKCGQLISYDVMEGSQYCQRRLKQKFTNHYICPCCGKEFPKWYWGVSGKAGGLGTIKKFGLPRFNFERHKKACKND